LRGRLGRLRWRLCGQEIPDGVARDDEPAHRDRRELLGLGDGVGDLLGEVALGELADRLDLVLGREPSLGHAAAPADLPRVQPLPGRCEHAAGEIADGVGQVIEGDPSLR
jgi:hypothetical protein